ncbi:3-oxoacyl-[acyl-carrier protein] reductase [Mycobacterium sp. OAS707]|uniref:SDR family NAD(P)-dependent oxidoreductase n=1 Tax=Mycobacterium sp. OAS707 TaxID=2663822 RepID=UPI00178A7381|nr:SDR family oxidoreductase [Mycobacterium sp. OAS707]MBE1549571.1 3-oxoacyl-[acyl-carrier protein] reductase [Mycobacterium sp. OAS707]
MSDAAAVAPQRIGDMLCLRGEVALVTGAGRGIGETTAHFLAAQGAAVAVNDYHPERAAGVVAAIQAEGGTAVSVSGDVTDYRSITSVVASARHHLGPVTILVNNAGNAGATSAGNRNPFWDSDPESWEPYLSVNLDAVLYSCRAVVPAMIEAGHGRLITVISEAGRVGEAGMEAYSAAKAGAAGLMRALARSLARFHITANSISIGITDTPAMNTVLADTVLTNRVMSRYLVRRPGQPSDVAAMVTYLASATGSWITGQTYSVNGGFSVNQ